MTRRKSSWQVLGFGVEFEEGPVEDVDQFRTKLTETARSERRYRAFREWTATFLTSTLALGAGVLTALGLGDSVDFTDQKSALVMVTGFVVAVALLMLVVTVIRFSKRSRARRKRRERASRAALDAWTRHSNMRRRRAALDG
ncbi:hypothetical protein [Cellulosimicrobium protaetiae]|uniref:Uncharacterized protein n=1 Tax=Cellulosimicrobium protaetiae TaxID=2587808 RepID=A0A6M5UL89_9MICO|nr:hypothetical protein [Cellulosimicrobium protaetiae]QJW38754.1 hypothetical protein FIC82_020435 [Cellulosimicrobium protaetiae]